MSREKRMMNRKKSNMRNSKDIEKNPTSIKEHVTNIVGNKKLLTIMIVSLLTIITLLSTSFAMLIEKNKGKEKLENVLTKISEKCSTNLQRTQMERIIRYILQPMLKNNTDKMIEKFREIKEVKMVVKTAQDYIKEEFEG